MRPQALDGGELGWIVTAEGELAGLRSTDKDALSKLEELGFGSLVDLDGSGALMSEPKRFPH